MTTEIAPPLTTYKIKSNTIPDMIETLDIVEWENGINPVITFTDYFRYWYGPHVKVQVSLTHNYVQVEYE